MHRPDVATTVADLRDRLASWRRAGERIALVPTMGALHAGHLSLVSNVAKRCDRVVVSIFVNPTQFAPTEDFAAYPRDVEGDLAKLSGSRVDLVYAPAVSEIYPDGASTTVTVGGPADGLESDARPHFFTGVATVVAKLLIQCAPDVAIFGEKDFQQLAVIRRMALDLSLPLEILAGPTVREESGLAMSSRNAYLSQDERRSASGLHAALSGAAGAIEAGSPPDVALVEARHRIRNAGLAVDYVEYRDAASLGPASPAKPGRILAAARIAGVRLIDNVPVASYGAR